ncbi:hypothetical protein ESZ50_04945 [Weissella muntiaci]|uniref:Uncharacterized protein n=1 Tax=Weissella muntiaci TaxID=2508881 RepID=A0A6C2C7F5_9LACO|nr:hypothetical protein [Weissella muntiaci]TYC49940.1 hypothetical protein ESZ50_04945 [Weissella muntiaci]
MTDKAILEFKTADLSRKISAMRELRNMSNSELADFVSEKTNTNTSSADISNLLAGRTKGPAAEKKIRVMRELFNV